MGNYLQCPETKSCEWLSLWFNQPHTELVSTQPVLIVRYAFPSMHGCATFSAAVFCSRFLSIYTGSTRLWTRSHKVPLCFSQTSAHSFHSNCHTYTDAIPVFISVRHTHGNLFAFKTDHIRQQIFFINSLLLSLSADLSWPLLCSMHFQCYYTFNDTAVSGFGRSCEELVELHLETGLVINTVVNYL